MKKYILLPLLISTSATTNITVNTSNENCILCVSVLLSFRLLLCYLRNLLHISQQETQSQYTKIMKILRKVTRVKAVIKRALIKTAKLTKAIQNEKSLPSIQAAASLTHEMIKQKV